MINIESKLPHKIPNCIISNINDTPNLVMDDVAIILEQYNLKVIYYEIDDNSHQTFSIQKIK